MSVIEIKHLYPEAQPEIVVGDTFHVGGECYLQIISNGSSFSLLDLSNSDMIPVNFESVSDIINHVTVVYGGFELIRRHHVSITLTGKKRTFEI
ncbi:hypothetical protein V7094_29130 [Priestia megaterium]|uniref:hypothetical protein n=1 Tax=Priestia megaterium TaxID=1404 RepID=UPI002FFDCD52